MDGGDEAEPVESVEGQALLALAVRFGETRLIDNLILGEGEACEIPLGAGSSA